jgi:hypothetical protein
MKNTITLKLATNILPVILIGSVTIIVAKQINSSPLYYYAYILVVCTLTLFLTIDLLRTLGVKSLVYFFGIYSTFLIDLFSTAIASEFTFANFYILEANPIIKNIANPDNVLLSLTSFLVFKLLLHTIVFSFGAIVIPHSKTMGFQEAVSNLTHTNFINYRRLRVFMDGWEFLFNKEPKYSEALKTYLYISAYFKPYFWVVFFILISIK